LAEEQCVCPVLRVPGQRHVARLALPRRLINGSDFPRGINAADNCTSRTDLGPCNPRGDQRGNADAKRERRRPASYALHRSPLLLDVKLRHAHFQRVRRRARRLKTSFFKRWICCAWTMSLACCTAICRRCSLISACCSLMALMKMTLRLAYLIPSTSPLAFLYVKRGSTSATCSAIRPMSCSPEAFQVKVVGFSRSITLRPSRNGCKPVL